MFCMHAISCEHAPIADSMISPNALGCSIELMYPMPQPVITYSRVLICGAAVSLRLSFCFTFCTRSRWLQYATGSEGAFQDILDSAEGLVLLKTLRFCRAGQVTSAAGIYAGSNGTP